MHDSRKSNLNLFQRHTKATRWKEKCFFWGFSPERKISREKEITCRNRGRVGGEVCWTEATRKMLHDGNSCLIVVSGYFSSILSCLLCNYCSKEFLIDCILILKHSQPSDVTHSRGGKVFPPKLSSSPHPYRCLGSSSGIIINLHSLF